jgi:hypothetical protein
MHHSNETPSTLHHLLHIEHHHEGNWDDIVNHHHACDPNPNPDGWRWRYRPLEILELDLLLVNGNHQ